MNNLITYTVKSRKIYPTGSILFTIISLIWLFIESLSKEGVETALAFTVGFGALALIEFFITWAKATKYSGFTYTLNENGIEKKKNAWRKQYNWNNMESFYSDYDIKYGNIIKWLPLSSFIISSHDKSILKFKEKEISDYWFGSDVRIQTNEDNHDEVVKYISKFIPYKRQDIKKVRIKFSVWILIISFSIIISLIIMASLYFKN